MERPVLDYVQIMNRAISWVLEKGQFSYELLVEAGADAMWEAMSVETPGDTVEYTETEEHVESKKWYTSKTLWVNVIAAIAIIVGREFEFALDASEQAAILAIINIVLRVATKQPMEA